MYIFWSRPIFSVGYNGNGKILHSPFSFYGHFSVRNLESIIQFPVVQGRVH